MLISPPRSFFDGRLVCVAALGAVALAGCGGDGGSNDLTHDPANVHLDLGPPSPDGSIHVRYPDAGTGGTGGTGTGGSTWDTGTGGTGGTGGKTADSGISPADDVTVSTLASGEVPMLGGLSSYVHFTVPDDAVGLTIFGLGDPSGMYVVEQLEDATGEALVTGTPEAGNIPGVEQITPWPGQFSSPNRSAANEAMATLLVPNNPELTLHPGDWRVRFAGANARTGRGVSGNLPYVIRVKRASALPPKGVLGLNLYFTGARGWTAASAQDDPDFRAAIFRMQSFYTDIGVELKLLSWNDISTRFQVIDTFQGEPNNELSQLYSEGVTGEGVNLFFIDRFAGQLGAQIGGIAGAVPGPSGEGLGGTPRSGVAVATTSDPDPRSIGHVMGHETGHYLGLFHTSELFAGNVNDPIPDTPTGQGGNTNLMFPTVTTGVAHLTEQQGRIVRGTPTVLPAEGDAP